MIAEAGLAALWFAGALALLQLVLAIIDNDAEMAGDMRALVRTRVAAGESADSVRRSLIRSYGDYVTYDPPFSAVTAPLWIAPLLPLASGALIAARSFKRGRR